MNSTLIKNSATMVLAQVISLYCSITGFGRRLSYDSIQRNEHHGSNSVKGDNRRIIRALFKRQGWPSGLPCNCGDRVTSEVANTIASNLFVG